MAKIKNRTYNVGRVYIVDRRKEISAPSLEAAAAKLKELKYGDFDEDSDVTNTDEESVFVDYRSSIQGKL